MSLKDPLRPTDEDEPNPLLAAETEGEYEALVCERMMQKSLAVVKVFMGQSRVPVFTKSVKVSTISQERTCYLYLSIVGCFRWKIKHTLCRKHFREMDPSITLLPLHRSRT